MARVAATEDVEGVREQEAFLSDAPSTIEEEEKPEGEHGLGGDQDEAMEQEKEKSPTPKQATPSSTPATSGKRKYVATVQEVHEAFDAITVLRYSQPCHLQGTFATSRCSRFVLNKKRSAGKCQGLTIIPFNAGHTLGGTIWKIRSPTAGTILYAVDMSHMRERHLDGTVLMMRPGSGSGVFETLQRPDLLITDAERANITTARRKDRDAALLGESFLTSRELALTHVLLRLCHGNAE